ncbi:sigma-70 family RNA polymerase sigma factor [Clostridium saccharoperbutylacetonicum]|uniref:sigma-70 family RNA polymerase sigma factor n=1 Tax=Clostridium saccharoperbutylacetonicum TaxID=36745 RepID=UPI0009838C52|nr:sigma-70 family RNA polymerase sigma factor [Clostridium saccharoperbutylacetonicum]AQR93296.1 RNA polymerase sigma factor CnrH [Clostridium saccharoperbutylacetonicum]NSB34713.1 RNA polymerase sigma-70 factor (ECF subfamily) [Clostridium saccharoperbutylacetonicum]
MRCTEKNYISRLKRGKEDALEFIVDKYLGLVKSAVYKVLASIDKNELIEECINDVFLSIWNNSDKFTGEEVDFKKWIFKIARFKAIDYYRREVKNIDLSIEDREISSNELVEEEIIKAEERSELLNLINTLEPMDRDIFVMKFFLGIKSEDIAKKLGLTRAAIDNRIYRGKKKLGEKITRLNLEVV